MVKKTTKKKGKVSSKKVVQKSTNDPKINAFITTFFSIIGFIVAMVVWRDDKYVMHYAKQSLVLFVTWVFVAIIGSAISFLPIIGWFIAWALNVLVLVGWILTWVYALSGELKEIPFVSNFTSKFKL